MTFEIVYGLLLFLFSLCFIGNRLNFVHKYTEDRVILFSVL